MNYYPRHGRWCNARTFPTDCWNCGKSIFVFMCDCHSVVLFDELGQPWPKHDCRDQSNRVDVFGGAQYTSEVMSFDDEYEMEIVKAKKTNKLKKWDFVKCDPQYKDAVQDVGVIRDIVLSVDLWNKYKLEKNTIGSAFLGRLKDGEYGQLTIHTGDITQESGKSYTFMLNKKLVDISKIIRHSPAGFRLRAHLIPGHPPIWVCEKLSL
jgi:hypothetical protein